MAALLTALAVTVLVMAAVGVAEVAAGSGSVPSPKDYRISAFETRFNVKGECPKKGNEAGGRSVVACRGSSARESSENSSVGRTGLFCLEVEVQSIQRIVRCTLHPPCYFQHM
jgi:hypothetical protein